MPFKSTQKVKGCYIQHVIVDCKKRKVELT